MKICSKCTHSQAIQGSLELIWKNYITVITDPCILCSEWVPSEGGFKWLIKTSQYSTSNISNPQAVCLKDTNPKAFYLQTVAKIRVLCIILFSPVKKSSCLNQKGTPLWWSFFFSLTFSFSLHKMSIDGLELCILLVDYCDAFISCLDSKSDGRGSSGEQVM